MATRIAHLGFTHAWRRHCHMSVAPKTHAKVVGIKVDPVFYSASADRLQCTVTVDNPSEYPHSCQVVFRGYVRTPAALYYEFLHEQCWLVVERQTGETEHDCYVELWLPRFPPTMEVHKDLFVEYSVRAAIDPWFMNTHKEVVFKVERALRLKTPHEAAHSGTIEVNECVGHDSFLHRKCSPVVGEIRTEKRAYTFGETVSLEWKLEHEKQIKSLRVALIKITSRRVPNRSHPLEWSSERTEILSADTSSTESKCEFEIPRNLPITMKMSLWNVVRVDYEIRLTVKTSPPVQLYCPIIICSESIKSHKNRDADIVYSRSQDILDDSGDDDDYDSDVEDGPLDDMAFVKVIDVRVHTTLPGIIDDAYAEVAIYVRGEEPRSLHHLRLLFTGEAAAGATSYEFLRYKAFVGTSNDTKYSPGEHVIKVPLPFDDNSQYDNAILPPTLEDDVRYMCRASLSPWELNDDAFRCQVFVDRDVDTWVKQEYHAPYLEKLATFGVKMRQRVFQRGKHVICTVFGRTQKLTLTVIQQRRLRQPGLGEDGSYKKEKVVARYESPNGQQWEDQEWAVRLPQHIPPSIEISYWNVLLLSYVLHVKSRGADGSVNSLAVPIWVGCSDDKLEAPTEPVPLLPVATANGTPSEFPDELPEFEVWNRAEVHEHPWWVKRLNDDTYEEDE